MNKKFEESGNLIYGQSFLLDQGRTLMEVNTPITQDYIYYNIAGMLTAEYYLPGGEKIKYYIQPGDVFGLGEVLGSKVWLSTVKTVEKSCLYRWKVDHFFQAADEVRRLAVIILKSLSRQLRILNAEYSELKEKAQGRRLEGDPEVEEALPKNLYSFSSSATGQQRQTFTDKQVLIEAGEIQKEIFWILSGQVQVTKKIGGKHEVLANLGKGELVGEMSFFDKSLASANVIADGDVQAMVFSKHEFKEIFFTNPKWVKRLLVSMAQRNVFMVKKLLDLKSREGVAEAASSLYM